VSTNWQEIIAAVDRALDGYLPPADTFPPDICRAVRYSVFAGGKRLRPLLVITTAGIFDVPLQHALPAACAIEMIHTYSLIHDDLPALDNDDYRRGLAANHKVFGEAMAILAGDALLTAAFETLSIEAPAYFPPNIVVALIQEISRAAGISGMIGGQVVDILSEGRSVQPDVLEYIHRHKTGALITCCVRCGARMGQAAPEQLQALTAYGEKVGLAFQIVDDILDIVGDEAVLGKKTGADASKKKVTYPAVYGLEKARAEANSLYKSALADLAPFGGAAAGLKELAGMLINRIK
jgi:geranylgeranyl diphosphate synthase type II